MQVTPSRGLVAAPHTPFDPQGELALEHVEAQATRLVSEGIIGVFVGGSTGEFAALTIDERSALAERWIEVARPLGLRVVVHVGGTQVEAGEELARHAAAAGADGIAALAPYYYRPTDVDALLACCLRLASGAPETPFYYYDIPAMTGVDLPLIELVERAREHIPRFAGVKFTSSDLLVLQELLGRGLDVLHGTDETLLAGLALGLRGAVGSTYNLAPGPPLRLVQAQRAGDLESARVEQRRTVDLVRTLVPFGYLPAARATLGLLGVEVGPPRLPHRGISPEQLDALREALEAIGFFEWRTAPELVGSDAVAW